MKDADHNASSHNQTAPLPWVVRWLAGLQPGASMLDFAAGAGRHARYAATLGLQVTAADRDVSRLQDLTDPSTVVQADLEADAWPFAGQLFDAVVVTNFLHRPRLAELTRLVAPGGWLIYQTFADGNALYGRPRNPDFLLQPGELLTVASSAGLVVAGYEHGRVGRPATAVVQRVAAWRAPEHSPGGSDTADPHPNLPGEAH